MGGECEGDKMRNTLLHHCDEIMPLNQFMSMSEIVKAAKELNVKNSKGQSYSGGAAKTMIRRSLEQKDGLFEADIQDGKLVAKRVRDGCAEVADKNQWQKTLRQSKSMANKKIMKRVEQTKIPEHLKYFPRPGTLSQEVYTSQRIYL